jgi:hypothetical protein
MDKNELHRSRAGGVSTTNCKKETQQAAENLPQEIEMFKMSCNPGSIIAVITDGRLNGTTRIASKLSGIKSRCLA